MNVLSLFDGMSCGQIALERAGIKVDNYYAAEVDKYAIQVTQKNYPSTIQLGDVRHIKAINVPKIDLLMAGSPCQGFSVAGKGLNFNDPRSALFFEFVRLLKECKPKWWLLENVKMKKEHVGTISHILKVKPMLINSADFSAQNRQRYYWTNIPFKKIWDESKEVLEDVLEPRVDEKYFIEPQRAITILDKETEKGKIAFIGKGAQGSRIYNIHGKSLTILAEGGGLGAKTGLYSIPCITPDRLSKRQNGRRFRPAHSKSYTLTTIDNHGVLILQTGRGINPGGLKAKNGKTPSLTTSQWQHNNHLVDLLHGRIRRLTPTECERLQTVPDNYTSGVSNSQRYKMLGNGWTVDVIVHILNGIKRAK
jgi:DNA (cytosine-5)-methyltransferase 3A